MADCARLSLRAAAEKLPASTTATKTWNWSSVRASISIRLSDNQYRHYPSFFDDLGRASIAAISQQQGGSDVHRSNYRPCHVQWASHFALVLAGPCFRCLLLSRLHQAHRSNLRTFGDD